MIRIPTPMVLFTKRPNNLFSWLVRKLTKQEYSHVLLLDVATWQTYESRLGGCRKQSGWHEKDVLVEVVTLPVLSEQQHAELIWRAESELGSAYDIPALLWFLLVIAARRVGVTIPPLHINPRWFLCSEYVWYILSGRKETITPDELFDRLKR